MTQVVPLEINSHVAQLRLAWLNKNVEGFNNILVSLEKLADEIARADRSKPVITDPAAGFHLHPPGYDPRKRVSQIQDPMASASIQGGVIQTNNLDDPTIKNITTTTQIESGDVVVQHKPGCGVYEGPEPYRCTCGVSDTPDLIPPKTRQKKKLDP